MSRAKHIFLILWMTAMPMMAMPSPPAMQVTMDESGKAMLSNGIVSMAIDAKGRISSCVYDGTELVSPKNTWYFSYNSDKYHELAPTRSYIKTQTADMIEVVYANEVAPGIHWSQGWILRAGVSGVYTYLVAEGTETEERLGEARMVYRLDDSHLHYGYIREDLQGDMPHHELMQQVNTKATTIQDATFLMPDSTIYTKYNWVDYMDADLCHGIMSDSIGVWSMSVSREYISGGPLKQDILLHSDIKSTLLLQMLHSGHFGTAAPLFKTGVTKIYGPCFIYLNKGTRAHMIADAKREAQAQEAAWPYSWFGHENYPTERATVTGKIAITNKMPKAPMQVILAQAGNVYNQGDGYIFWAKTDKQGRFTIKNVRSGTYALHAYALAGENTDELEEEGIEVSGKQVALGTINWQPEKHGRLVWQIGEADRMTDGFGGWNLPRDYSNAKQSPLKQTYVIGKNKPADWYYVQGPKSEWSVVFDMKKIDGDSVYLTGALAAISYLPVMKIEVNGEEVGEWIHWECQVDPSVYRSANRSGYYQRMQCVFPASLLKKGENVISIRMPKLRRRGYGGVLWDCLKMEIE